MKRHSSSDQLIPICPSGEEQGVYGRGFPSSMLDMEGEDCGDDELLCSVGGGQGSNGCGEKKRRLSVEQVRALETSFEVENKLEPERKLRLAQELGLQPRQVAIWFQNRRARWKTKRLERDYNALKANYDLLRVDYDALLRDKESLLAEIKELKTKLSMDENLSSSFVKEEPLASESEDKISEEQPALIYKDGSVDSDSSVVLNDENSSQLAVVASNNMAFHGSTPPFTTSSSSSLFVSSDARVHKGGLLHGHHYLKVEESGFLSGDEPCSSSFFSDEQPPSLSWYYSEQWN